MLFSFERLEVWHNSKELCKLIYCTADKFPQKEQFGLRSQLTRAAVSVASNIAEGSARKSPKDQARFSQIAYSSLMEVLCQLLIAYELKYITDVEYQKLRTMIEVVSNKLNALHKSQLQKNC